MSPYFAQILEKARGQWPYILESAGINLWHLKNKHGACPICGGKDRFRFDDKEGRGTYICNQCGTGDGLNLLMLHTGYNFKEALCFIERTLNGNPEPIGDILKRIKPLTKNTTEENSQEIRKRLIDVWSQSQPIIRGDPPDRYLQARGIKLNSWPKSLRYHPNLSYYDDEKRVVIGKFPAMIALVQNQHKKGVSLHRTYLGDGCKANVPKPKKIMSPAIKGSILGGAIQLYPPAKDSALVLAEGIETALAIHIATGLYS